MDKKKDKKKFNKFKLFEEFIVSVFDDEIKVYLIKEEIKVEDFFNSFL